LKFDQYQQPVYLENATSITQQQKDLIHEAMTLLDGYISNGLWFAGDKLTIADLSILANVTQIQACGYNIAQHTSLSKWLDRCKALPGFEENQEGADELGKFFKSKVSKGF
jgi:glutathione S-transferase